MDDREKIDMLEERINSLTQIISKHIKEFVHRKKTTAPCKNIFCFFYNIYTDSKCKSYSIQDLCFCSEYQPGK